MSIPGAASPLFIGAAAGAAAGYQISRSLRFTSGDSAYLNRTPSSAGNRKTFTLSFWIKRAGLTSNTGHAILYAGTAGSTTNRTALLIGNASFSGSGNSILFGQDTSGSWTTYRETSALFRDHSAWAHIVLAVDSTQATGSDRIKIYVNGVLQTSFATSNDPAQNFEFFINNNNAHYLGDDVGNFVGNLDAYLAEIHHVDGSQLAASDFGEYDSNNVWQPKQYAGTYGTNGFHLKFADNSSNAALGTDSSGNSNTWTVNNIFATARNYTSEGSISGSFYDSAGGAASKMFDGSASTGAFSQSGTATFTFGGSTITASTSLVIRAFKGNSAGANVLVNGTDISSLLNTQSGGGYSNVDITSTLGGAPINLSNVSVVNVSGGSGNIAQIFVDGVELVDASASDIDSLIDTPTNYEADSGNNGGNYALLNPLISPASSHLSDGNLKIAATTTSWVQATSTIGVNSGKWYWEVLFEGTNTLIGVTSNPNSGSYIGQVTGSYGRDAGGGYYINGSNGTGYTSFASGTTLGVALDMDNGTVTLYFNGSAESTFATGLDTSKTFYAGVSVYGSTSKNTINFGQRPFAYTPPTNHLALVTTNLSDPTIADGSTAMNATTYTGNGSTQAVTGLNHSPDLAWIKHRTRSQSHVIYDIVRGAGTGKSLSSNSSGVEGGAGDGTVYGYLSAFGSDGFTVIDGSDAEDYVNKSGAPYIAWTWDGGSSTSSNSDGSITTNVRANASAGFSIIGYTGNATVGATIGHGLNSAPEWLVFKNRDESAGNWYVYHKSAGHTKYLTLDRTHAAITNDFLNNTAPTNSVVTLNNTAEVNATGQDIICYAWTSISQYSSFGSYTGNGSSDGPFVFTGFRPRWILIKDIGGAINWRLLDTARNTFNLAENGLHPNTAGVENTTNMAMDILSNGFKIKATADINASGNNHIYAAFAEHPFKTSRAR